VQIGPNILWRYSCAFLKAGITVIGVEGAENTIVDGGEETDANVITFLYSYEEGPTTRIEGFTITGGGTGFMPEIATGSKWPRAA
jgi:hypothetical protein